MTVRVELAPEARTEPVHDEGMPQVKMPPLELVSVPPDALNATVGETGSGPLLRTVTVYVAEPAALTVGGPVIVTLRSADPPTVTVATAELLPGTGSPVVVTSDAVFVIVPTALAVRTTVMVAVEPKLRLAMLQVIGPVPLETAPP